MDNNYLHYRMISDYEKINQIEEGYETPSSQLIFSFSKADMIPIFQSQNAHVYDSSTKLYWAHYSFHVQKGKQILYIEGNGYYPQNSRGTAGKTLTKESYTLCEVDGDKPPFQSKIIASTSFITAGNEGYSAQGTYTNQKDRSSLTIKSNQEIVLQFN
jgi:hypothetical protein